MENFINNQIEHHHRFAHNIRLRLLADGIIVGCVAGLVISAFRFALQYGETFRSSFYNNLIIALNNTQMWLWLAGLGIIAAILTKLIKLEPLAGGSGIPQVKGALLNLITMNWWRIIWVKIVGGVLAIGAGLSLGREGPSIQLGAMTAQGLARISHQSKIEEHYLLSSGAAAGLAAAFNAPLAGVIFALEELHHNFSIVVLMPAMGAAFTATMVSRALFGSDTVFHFPEFTTFPLTNVAVIVVTAIFAGLMGVLFNKGLLNIPKFYQLKCFNKVHYKVIFALVVSILLGCTLPQVLGGGSELINYLAKTPVTLQFLCLLLLTKFIFTLLSYGVGCPGGFFLPMLVIGALTGGVCGKVLLALGLIEKTYFLNILVMAMVAFFAASVRAPITGTVLIMEMSKSYAILLSCGISAMIGFAVAECLHSAPIYEAPLHKTLQEEKYRHLLEEQNLAERNDELQNNDRLYSED